MMLELKATNKIVDGARVNNLNWKNEWKGLFKDVEGFERTTVGMGGDIKPDSGMSWWAGFKHSGNDHFFELISQLRSNPWITSTTVWRAHK